MQNECVRGTEIVSWKAGIDSKGENAQKKYLPLLPGFGRRKRKVMEQNYKKFHIEKQKHCTVHVL